MELFRFGWLALSLASCAAPAQLIRGDPNARSPEDESVGKNSIAVVLGQRELSDDAEPLEDQSVFGVELAFASEAGPRIELGFLSSSESDNFFVGGVGFVDAEISANEFFIGLRTPAPESAIRPYFGGGLTYIEAEVEVSSGGGTASADDSTIGLYLHAGIQAAIAEHVLIGVDVRSVFGADVEIAGVDFDADYLQFAATIGVWY